MNYSTIQIVVLTTLRLMLGYHFLYEGIDKLFSPDWTSGGFLIQANWLFAGVFHSLANSNGFLAVIDFLNIYGQICIGLGLILGLFGKIAAYSGAHLLLLYYIVLPPFMNNQLFIDKNLIELLAFLVVALFNTSEIIGIDRIPRIKMGNKNG